MSRVDLVMVRGPGDFTKLQVLKRLLPNLAADTDFLEMFLEEARISARLNHANIVQINEIGFDGHLHFMAMEYLEGQTLDAVVRASSKKDGLPLAMHLRIIADACAGLHYAHELTDIDGRPLHIVHRDVSPHNVFVTYTGQVKVLDFGIAKAADSSHHTRTGVIKGKAAYMSPEQIRQGHVDRRADVFALGVLIWQAATRTRMWHRLSEVEIYHRLAMGDVPSPLSVDPFIPTELVAICDRALALDRAQRFATAQELGDAIEAYLATLPGVPSSREIGKYVSDLFAENRAKVKAAIEAELKRGDGFPVTTSDIPVFVDRDAVDDETRTPLVEAEGVTEGSGAQEPSIDPREVGRGGSKLPLLSSLGGAILLAVGAVFGVPVLQAWQAAHPPAATTVPSASPAARAPVSAPTAAEPNVVAGNIIVLKVEVIPHSASVFVDDVPLSANPGSARFVRDAVPHRILGEAAGYARQLVIVAYDQAEKEVTITLDREPSDDKPPAPKHAVAGQTHGPVTSGREKRAGGDAVVKSPGATEPAAASSPPAPPAPLGAAAATNPPPPTNTALPTPAPIATAASSPPPGTIDLNGIRATVRNHSGEVQDCYDRAHLESTDLHGHVVVSSTIGPQGQVLSASVSRSTTNSARLEQCLINVFERWTFPQPTGGVNGTVTYTFKFD